MTNDDSSSAKQAFVDQIQQSIVGVRAVEASILKALTDFSNTASQQAQNLVENNTMPLAEMQKGMQEVENCVKDMTLAAIKSIEDSVVGVSTKSGGDSK